MPALTDYVHQMLEHVLTASMNADSAQRLAATEEQRYQSDAKESRGVMRRLADAACGQDSAFAEEIRRRRNEIEKLYDPDNLSLKEVQVHQEVIGTKLRQVGFVFEPAFRLGFNVIIFIEVRVTTNASKQHNGKLAADLIVVLEKTVDGCKGKLEVKKTTATAKPESFHKPTSTFNQLLDRIDRSKGRVASAFIVDCFSCLAFTALLLSSSLSCSLSVSSTTLAISISPLSNC